MAFEDYLEIIKSDSDGENVSSAISNALLYLTSGTAPIYEADVTEEAATVASSAYGKDVKGAIYSALKKISDSGETSLVIIELSQAEYDALEVKDQTQVYGITDNLDLESLYEYKYSKCYLGTVELERIFIGDTQVWGSTPQPPGPAWDETKINVMWMVDDVPEFHHFTTHADAAAYIESHWREYDGGCYLHMGTNPTTSFPAMNSYQYRGATVAMQYADINGMTTIPDSCFEGNYENGQLIKVKMDNNVTSIGDYAFSVNPYLNEVRLSSNLSTIGEFAFADDRSLSEINIPSSVTSIGDRAFDCCTGITINIAKAEGSISGAPWGADFYDESYTINWLGGLIYQEVSYGK